VDDFPDHSTIGGSVGRIYTRYRLSPPLELYRAAQNWLGVPLDEILAAVEDHLEAYRQYYCGAGDAHFGMVQTAISELQMKHGVDAYARADGGVSDRPPPRRRGISKVYTHGVADAFDDRDDSEADVSRLHAPQPRIRPSKREDYSSIGEDIERDVDDDIERYDV
jgi:hypothetical protein